jgi:hypothetical protein
MDVRARWRALEAGRNALDGGDIAPIRGNERPIFNRMFSLDMTAHDCRFSVVESNPCEAPFLLGSEPVAAVLLQGEMRVPTAASQETCSCRGSGMSLTVPRDGVRRAFRSRDALPDGSRETSEQRTGVKVRTAGGLLYDVPVTHRSLPGAGR